MIVIKVVRITTLLVFTSVFILITVLSVMLYHTRNDDTEAMVVEKEPDWSEVLDRLFDERNRCVLSGDTAALKTAFLTDERNGQYAYENEAFRSRYLNSWAAKQGIRFVDISSQVSILRSRSVGRGYAFYMIVSTEYAYVYENDPEMVNMFRMGAYHSMDLIPGNTASTWVISREWYDDPMTKSFDSDLYTPEMTAFIASHSPADFSELGEARLGVVKYADDYCGAASDGSNGYQYNQEYTDYNALGGNCANFASQALYEGGGFKKNGTWNYQDGKGSRSWINAQGFKDYLLYSGHGSLIARGKYTEVYKAAFELRPGDMIAYAYKGDVTHISIVTGQDSKGYPLVNSHNLDRFHVPWDIGWNTGGYSFYLIHVNYP